MAVPVIMPKMEMSQESATVIEWLKHEGEPVEKGQPLLTVETDKVTVEVESPSSGILMGVSVLPQQEVPVTETIAYILQPGEALPVERPRGENGTGLSPPEAAPAGAVTPVARRLAEAHNVDLSTIVGTGARGQITRADVESAVADTGGPTVAGGQDKVRATPAARRIAREQDVDLGAVTGSGPRGRVQAADVVAFVPVPTAAAVPVGEVVLLQGIRRTIAERMSASYRTAPHISLTARVDMGRFEETRTQLNAKAKAAGQALAEKRSHVSMTALIVKAVAWTLKQHPWLNSTLRGEEIHLLPEINVGVAVALEDGLIVPVVRQADRKGVTEIAVEVNERVARAREGRLTPADVSGGTFTISNLGPLGIEQFTAIINPPQAAILALGTSQPEAVVGGGGEITARPVMRMTLSADHRIVDGAVAAHFLGRLREALEMPTLLLW